MPIEYMSEEGVASYECNREALARYCKPTFLQAFRGNLRAMGSKKVLLNSAVMAVAIVAFSNLILTFNVFDLDLAKMPFEDNIFAGSIIGVTIFIAMMILRGLEHYKEIQREERMKADEHNEERCSIRIDPLIAMNKKDKLFDKQSISYKFLSTMEDVSSFDPFSYTNYKLLRILGHQPTLLERCQSVPKFKGITLEQVKKAKLDVQQFDGKNSPEALVKIVRDFNNWESPYPLNVAGVQAMLTKITMVLEKEHQAVETKLKQDHQNCLELYRQKSEALDFMKVQAAKIMELVDSYVEKEWTHWGIDYKKNDGTSLAFRREGFKKDQIL